MVSGPDERLDLFSGEVPHQALMPYDDLIECCIVKPAAGFCQRHDGTAAGAIVVVANSDDAAIKKTPQRSAHGCLLKSTERPDIVGAGWPFSGQKGNNAPVQKGDA